MARPCALRAPPPVIAGPRRPLPCRWGPKLESSTFKDKYRIYISEQVRRGGDPGARRPGCCARAAHTTPRAQQLLLLGLWCAAAAAAGDPRARRPPAPLPQTDVKGKEPPKLTVVDADICKPRVASAEVRGARGRVLGRRCSGDGLQRAAAAAERAGLVELGWPRRRAPGGAAGQRPHPCPARPSCCPCCPADGGGVDRVDALPLHQGGQDHHPPGGGARRRRGAGAAAAAAAAAP
jgi:hypothetical protein